MKRRKTVSTKRKKTKSKTRRGTAAKKAAARRPRKAPPRRRATTGKRAKTGKKRPTAASRKRAAAPRRKVRRAARGTGESPRARIVEGWQRGLGAESAGQAGDTEDISREEVADSESVEELLEEGQSFEAGIVEGVENAPDADAGEVTTREVPEDDVPEEYRDEKD